MAGRGDRRAAPRLVLGATVRMDFRGANSAKTCANRENDRLVILSRCGHDGVWLKTFTISNQRTQPSMRNVLPLSQIALDEYERCQPTEKSSSFCAENAVSLWTPRTPGCDLPRDRLQAKDAHSENQRKTNFPAYKITLDSS
jgi:hypothetical protein